MGTTSQTNPILDSLLKTVGSSEAVGGGPRLLRGMIAQILPSGEIQVASPSGGGGAMLSCDVLHTGVPLSLHVGDAVLAMSPIGPGERGLVLGLIAAYSPSTPEKKLVLEASESLSLKCGSSMIELRQDGRLLIRGKDVVSFAERTQRIKGGTVGIN